MTSRRTTLVWGLGLAPLLVIGLVVALRRSPQSGDRPPRTAVDSTRLERVVINEAVRTLLYLPLYHAQERGFFRDEGLSVEIVTGGTATNSFAALLSGEAQFSQADPMYVPISRQNGGRTKVVGQVVGRIAVWGLSRDSVLDTLTASTLRGKTISTQVRPMTAYTYAVKTVEDLGLRVDKDVRILQNQPGTEITPLLRGEADVAFTLEPSASTAVGQGARVVFSYPQLLGDQVFTGLMTTEDYLVTNRDVVVRLLRAYQRSLDELRSNPDGGLSTAQKYFPQAAPQVLQAALQRLVAEQVFPRSVLIPEDSWNRAVAVRVRAGDLRNPIPISEAADLDVMREGTRQPSP